MKTGNNALFELGISERPETCYELDGQIHYGVDGLTIAEDFLPVCAIIAGQMLGFYKSLELGLMPDEPSVAGAISRVVQGVTIYPLDTGAPMVHQGE
jgi:tagatose-6-phosphate ketose/aldose isomerase